MDIILKYFPDLSSDQQEKFARLEPLYNYWNERINLISRKDIASLYEKHILHSLAIAKIIRFRPGTKILDVGTGGGFPGIPLAIAFPETNFHLVDSIGKKINVVRTIAEDLGLQNVRADQVRAEELKERYDFIVSRAVTTLPEFVRWISKNIETKQQNSLPNGILYLKGGEISEEIRSFKKKVMVYNLSEWFNEEFFETKKLVFLPA